MGGQVSQSTAMRSEEKTAHFRRMLTQFQRLMDESEESSKRARTFYFYTWTKPFHLIQRPLDRHVVVDVTIDHHRFVTVELCKRFRGWNYNIYPDSRFLTLKESRKKELEFVGSKTFAGQTFLFAPLLFVSIAVSTMVKFGGYNFLFNNCQDFVDRYFSAIGITSSPRLAGDENVPHYHTDIGRLLWRYYKIVLFILSILIAGFLYGPSEDVHMLKRNPSAHTVYSSVYDKMNSMSYLTVCFIGIMTITRGVFLKNLQTVLDSLYYYKHAFAVIFTVNCVVCIVLGDQMSFMNWHYLLAMMLLLEFQKASPKGFTRHWGWRACNWINVVQLARVYANNHNVDLTDVDQWSYNTIIIVGFSAAYFFPRSVENLLWPWSSTYMIDFCGCFPKVSLVYIACSVFMIVTANLTSALGTLEFIVFLCFYRQ